MLLGNGYTRLWDRAIRDQLKKSLADGIARAGGGALCGRAARTSYRELQRAPGADVSRVPMWCHGARSVLVVCVRVRIRILQACHA